ncbi:hypothetical protein MMC13_008488 [Lambiella insularis]|nr:hypothetical protein [Lambiella insularis]
MLFYRPSTIHATIITHPQAIPSFEMPRIACSTKRHHTSLASIGGDVEYLENSPAPPSQHLLFRDASTPAIVAGGTTQHHSSLSRAFGTTAGVDDAKDRNEEKRTAPISRRIHILGLGNVGKLVAHSLAGIPNRPPVTLLFHRRGQVNDWFKEGRSIKILQHGVHEQSTGFDIEIVRHPDHELPSRLRNNDLIDHLIVSVNASATADALLNIVHRLHKDSTVLFLQNGMGILNEVYERVFRDPNTCPKLMLGIVTHRLTTESSFSSSLYGIGTIGIGYIAELQLPGLGATKEASQFIPPSARYLLRTVTRTPFLAAMGLIAPDLYQLQLEKLFISAVIDPLTVMFDCKNGGLLDNFAITRVMRLLIAEISLVIRSLPELQDIPNINMRFSPAKLEYQIISIAKTTATNESTMLRDVKGGRPTDADYLNGYIIRRGEELGIKCVMNYMLMQMVKGKQQIESRKLGGRLPWRDQSDFP